MDSALPQSKAALLKAKSSLLPSAVGNRETAQLLQASTMLLVEGRQRRGMSPRRSGSHAVHHFCERSAMAKKLKPNLRLRQRSHSFQAFGRLLDPLRLSKGVAEVKVTNGGA